MSRRLFGTDGVRGMAGVEPLTPELALALGRAVASRFRSDETRPLVTVGKDPRLSGDMLEAAFCAGLCAAGADVVRLGVLPTPAVALLTQKLGACAGAMISASHNAFADNGIKLFARDGFKLSDDTELEIEASLQSGAVQRARITGAAIGRIETSHDAGPQYLAHLRDSVESDLSLEGLKIVIDAGNGAASEWGARLFQQLGARVISLHDHPDGQNINEGCGAVHPASLQAAVIESGAHLGVALDGDADRAILVDELGQIRDGDACMALCGEQLLAEGRLSGRQIVATQMSNLGLELFFKERGVTLLRTQVGDRYVVETMRAENIPLGGEQSGHIIFLDHATTGDGLLTALQVARVLMRERTRLSERLRHLERFPQILLNVHLKERRPLNTLPGVVRTIEQAEASLQGNGRVLVRFSGTEPLARVMIEGRDLDQIRHLAQGILDEIARELA